MKFRSAVHISVLILPRFWRFRGRQFLEAWIISQRIEHRIERSGAGVSGTFSPSGPAPGIESIFSKARWRDRVPPSVQLHRQGSRSTGNQRRRPSRSEQAAYFGISLDSAIEVGREASEFTRQTLAKAFTIHTRWRRALGRSANWRYYAIVITTEGRPKRIACERRTRADLRNTSRFPREFGLLTMRFVISHRAGRE